MHQREKELALERRVRDSPCAPRPAPRAPRPAPAGSRPRVAGVWWRFRLARRGAPRALRLRAPLPPSRAARAFRGIAAASGLLRDRARCCGQACGAPADARRRKRGGERARLAAAGGPPATQATPRGPGGGGPLTFSLLALGGADANWEVREAAGGVGGGAQGAGRWGRRAASGAAKCTGPKPNSNQTKFKPTKRTGAVARTRGCGGARGR